jgi:hypothetical protein
VSYFQHTERDVTEASLAGRRKVAEEFAALLEDTARKMNGEPGEETSYDYGYLLEDLLSRGAELAKNYAADMPKHFPALIDGARAVPAYPLLIEAEAPERIAEIVAEGKSNRCPRCNHWPFNGSHGPQGCFASGDRLDGLVCGCTYGADETVAAGQENTIDLSDAIREAWQCETFNGRPRHEHVGDPDEKCRATVPSSYGVAGPHVRCGEYYGHAIHETDFETRTR